jgi:hypothetical protein
MTLCVWQARSSRPLADHITPLRQTQNPPMPQCRYGPCLPASHPHARYMSTSAQLSLSFPLLQLRNNQIERQMCYWLAYVQLVNTCTSMLTVRGTCRHASSCSLHFPRCTLLRRKRVMQMLSLVSGQALRFVTCRKSHAATCNPFGNTPTPRHLRRRKVPCRIADMIDPLPWVTSGVAAHHL